MTTKMFNKVIVALSFMVAACFQPDYAIVESQNPEKIYIEVEGPTTVVEVPVYIEVEVPVPVEGDIWVDSFTQSKASDGVDILWIIDTSGSMYRYDAQLLAGIETMLNALPASGWRLNIISSHPSCAANENRFPLVPGDDIADAMDMLSMMCTGGMERGFDAAYEYIVNNPYAATWMRPGTSALLIVFVSDEEEQSMIYHPYVSDFTFWYSMIRSIGSTYLASVINMDPSISMCERAPNLIDVGERYIEATNYFSGVVVDICNPDWSAGVTDASNNIEPKESLKLTHIPDPTSAIRVFINGSLNHDWYYGSSDNTIYFTVIPDGGSLVEIGYLYDPTITQDTGDTGQ